MRSSSLNFLFQINETVPRGQVAVRPLAIRGRFHVMAAAPLTDAQIVMAIARFVAKHDPANQGELPAPSAV